MEVCVTHCASPIGMIQISGAADGIASVTFLEGWDEHRACLREHCAVPSTLSECREQLQEYFAHKRRGFSTLRVLPSGTTFQQHVWMELMRIPWGESITYGELGRRVGYPTGAQAVGSAVGRNPLALLIPCHRVLPAHGEHGAYAWGLWRKQWLLRHERVAPKT